MGRTFPPELLQDSGCWLMQGGLITPITMTRGQPETNRCYYNVNIKHNKFTLPDGLKLTCVPAS